jgi:hypothetical protein
MAKYGDKKEGEIKSWKEQTVTLRVILKQTEKISELKEKGNYENEKAAKEKKDIWRLEKRRKWGYETVGGAALS